VRRILVAAVALLLPAVWLGTGTAGGVKGGKPNPNVVQEGETCGDFGTSVKFVKTPSDAAKQALKEEKLVFVLHVSGEFEEPDFT
jgi:hypothetical protein